MRSGRQLVNKMESTRKFWRPLVCFSRAFSHNWERVGASRWYFPTFLVGAVGVTAIGGTTLWRVSKKHRAGNRATLLPAVMAASSSESSEEQRRPGKGHVEAPAGGGSGPRHISYKEKRFQQFASKLYNGEIYMTPQDFLESVTEHEPRPRIGRARMTKEEVDSILNSTPNKRKSSKNFFRSLHNRGIISYTEYIFLITILTKPKNGFRLAFNMFDRDGNQKVDIQEFLLIEEILGKHNTSLEETPDDTKNVKPPDTTLLVHLFGKKGKDTLDYSFFYKFMDNLQTEVLEIEFNEFSRGMNIISELDFAKILLRYTNSSTESKEYAEYLHRIKTRIPEEKGITFEHFKSFCQFLNHLEDFKTAMRMYSYANQPVTQSEFQRAVKISTDHDLAPHVVNTVFQLFDKDGDGRLSHTEFIGAMKDRINRSFRYHVNHYEGWSGFKHCVKNELKTTQ